MVERILWDMDVHAKFNKYLDNMKLWKHLA